MKKSGFTLIELLVVIVIIGILAALISTNLYGGRQRATDSQKKSNLNQLKIALHSYYANYHKYPADQNGLYIKGCGTSGLDTCTAGSSFTAGGIEYLSKIPSGDFRYKQCDGGDSFRIKATMSNVSDPDIAESQLKCPVGSCGVNYSTSEYVLCGE